MFNIGDIVSIDGKGHYTLRANPSSSTYPLAANGFTFTTDGRMTVDGSVKLKHLIAPNPNCTFFSTPQGTIITLTDGTRIYQPNQGYGNPIQLLKDPNDSNRPTIT